MTQMMAHLVNAFGRILGIVPIYLREQRLLRENFFVERRAGLVEAENLAERRVVEAVRDLINLRQRQTGLLEAVRDRVDRKVTRLLVPIESLLCCGCYNRSVDYKRGRGIEALHDPVLAFVQSRPVRPLEAN